MTEGGNDSGTANLPMRLASERDELKELRDQLTPGIKKLLDAIAKRSNGSGFVLTEEEDRTLRVLDRFYQRTIQAAKAEAEIARIVGSQVTQEDMEAIIGKMGFYVFGGLDWSTEQISSTLTRFLEARQHWFASGVNARRAIEQIVTVAQRPDKKIAQRLRALWKSGELLNRNVPTPSQPVVSDDKPDPAEGNDGD